MSAHHDTTSSQQTTRGGGDGSACRRAGISDESTDTNLRVALRIAGALCVVLIAVFVSSCTVDQIGTDDSVDNTTRILGPRIWVTVTTNGGTNLVMRRDVPLTRGMTALDALEAVADVRRDVDGNVAQVNGLGGGRITALGSDQSAWLYRVNGVESDIAANRFRLKQGNSVWWDLRRFDIYDRLPVAVGEFPAPFFAGYRENDRPIRVTYGEEFKKDADYLADTLFQQMDPEIRPLRDDGSLGGVTPGGSGPIPVEAVRRNRANIVIGRWEDLRLDPYLLDIGLDPRGWGITTWIEGTDVRQQLPNQEFSRELKEAEGIVWATTIDGEPDSAFVIVITGTSKAGIRAASRSLRSGQMAYMLSAAVDRSGAIVTSDIDGPLPVPR